MRFYGSGVLRYPGTSRTVHDFEDGPFDTMNIDIIRHAINMGFSTVPPEPVEPQVAEDTSAPKRRGRKPKEKNEGGAE